jgi:hypothetical protein
MKAALAFLLLAAVPAWGYVPPSQFVVRMMAKRHEGTKVIRIRSTVTELEDDKPGKNHFKQVTVFDPARGILKSRAYDDAGQELYAVERRYGPPAATVAAAPTGSTEAPPPVVLKPGEAGPPAGALLLSANADTVSQILLSVGIPVRTEAELLAMKDEAERRASEAMGLARWKGQVAWLVGPAQPAENPPRKPEAAPSPSPDAPLQPQLWVVKDGFVPLRLVTAAEDGANEVRFESFRYVREFPFPRVITALRHPGGQVGKERAILREDVAEFSATGDLSELKAPVTLGYTDAGNSADSGVRELIRTFYALVR